MRRRSMNQKFLMRDAAAWPNQSLIRTFRDEIEDRLRAKREGVAKVASE